MDSPDPEPTDPAPPPDASPWGRDAVGWLASLVLHTLVCVALAWATLPPLSLSTTFRLTGEPPEAERIDEALSLDEAVELDTEDLSDPIENLSADSPVTAPTPDALAGAPAPAIDLSELLAPSAIATPTSGVSSVVSGVGTDGRSDLGRAALVAAKGGSRASEVAVARGLKWLENHQNPDGTWSLIHNRGACRGRCGNPSTVGGDDPFGESVISGTGLALLPFLGAGETHRSGRYRGVVGAGLAALVRLGHPEDDRPGLSWRDSGRMYAHGIATIVLCEAYGLTEDPELRRPAEAALVYLAHAQDPAGGGWRYAPQQPGDTSVTGWQIMALKSGLLAGLEPPRRVATRASDFLDSASGAGGSAYGYLAADDPAEYPTKPTLTAVGLLCRQYLGWKQRDPRLVRGVEGLAERGPIDGHYYHNYYAAQTIFHQTGGVGATWRRWNEAVRDRLVETQATRGHERGSWWAPGNHNERGGRLYSTSLATMTLEVYYRYLPLYRAEAVTTELPD